MAASETQVCNRALQKLGAKRISSLTEGTVNSRAMNEAYPLLRDALIRRYRWSFAISRAQLAADATAPTFGKARSFTLPSDYLGPMPPYPEDEWSERDWTIEGRQLFTDDSDPLDFRYMKRVTDTTLFDSLFTEALASFIAFETCEQITQSTSKKESLKEDFKDAIAEAKRVCSIERPPVREPDDDWLTRRA